jgi:hypothetical protein
MTHEAAKQLHNTGFVCIAPLLDTKFGERGDRTLWGCRDLRRQQRLAVRATLADRELIAQSARGAPLETFRAFFRYQPGRWRSERCYFYRVDDDTTKESTETTERSETVFQVEPLTPEIQQKVLNDNGTSEAKLVEEGFLGLEQAAGFRVSFDTKMERSGDVSASTNLLFVPRAMDAQMARQLGLVRGLYFRDKGYEEDRPIVGQFEFHVATRELVMITAYARTVSVDRILLCSERQRLRQIANYRKPVAWQDEASLERNRPLLTQVWLLGSGIEERLPN